MPAGAQLHARADGAAIAFCAGQADDQPVPGARLRVAQERWLVVHIGDNQLELAVTYKVLCGRPSPRSLSQDSGTGDLGQVFKGSVAQVAIKLPVLEIAQAGWVPVDLRIDVTVDDEYILPTVQVKIDKKRAPADVVTVSAQPRRQRHILKLPSALVPI